MTSLLRSAVTAAALIVSPGLANALELRCTMLDYGNASRHKGIEQLVPGKSVHRLSESTSRTKGMKGQGTLEYNGNKLIITYIGKLADVGDAEVSYTYSRNTGVVVVRTRGLRAVQWEEDHPERAGKYLITGKCNER